MDVFKGVKFIAGMRLDEAQGVGKARTEAVLKYSEGVLEPTTQRFVKSVVGASSSARRQEIAAHFC